MNKTIHVSAIVLAILILTVGCQGKKGGSRAEDEGSTSKSIITDFCNIVRNYNSCQI